VNTIQDELREHTDNVDSEIEDIQAATLKILEMEAKVVKVEESSVKEDQKLKSDLEEVGKKTAASVDELKKTFDEHIRRRAQQAAERSERMSEPTKRTAENGIFFTGLDVIRKREAINGDVTSVVHNILHKVGSSAYYTDVIAIHPKLTPRNSANSAIVYFQSTYHKRYASDEIRKFLAKERYAGVGLRDLFLREGHSDLQGPHFERIQTQETRSDYKVPN